MSHEPQLIFYSPFTRTEGMDVSVKPASWTGQQKEEIAVDLRQFLEQFQDHLAPKLDTYEQAIYLYIFRHSRLVGLEETTIGFKSARARMALGTGKMGSRMAESEVRKKLRSLTSKGCLAILGTERTGTRIRLQLPDEIPGVILDPPEVMPMDLEEMDFFEVPENRAAIVEREAWQCFYCLRILDRNNYVIEHVVSRPNGNNSYRNVVAACRVCNDRKGSTAVGDFLRLLYRQGYLAEGELEKRLEGVRLLQAGEIKPHIPR